MDTIALILGVLCSLLFGAIGFISAIWQSKEKKLEKESAEKAEEKLKAHNAAMQKVNEEKKKNEEKINQAHSGNHLSNAESVLDLLRK